MNHRSQLGRCAVLGISAAFSVLSCDSTALPGEPLDGGADARTILPDTGTILPDTGTIPPDTGTIPPDAGTILPDTGTIPPEGGQRDHSPDSPGNPDGCTTPPAQPPGPDPGGGVPTRDPA